MALRYAILGYLSSAPGSGYDLAQQLNEGLGWFWSASHSQIYPELKRLEAAGLIEGEPTTVGEKLEKRVYSISEEGREALVTWASGEPCYRPNRDPERLQLIFSDLADIPVVRGHLEAHRKHFADRRARLIAMRDRIISRQHPRVERRLHELGDDRAELSLLLRDLAYSGDIQRAELEIAWADEAIARLDDLVRSPAPARSELGV
jgi:PadR family transcriptional regulator AphA